MPAMISRMYRMLGYRASMLGLNSNLTFSTIFLATRDLFRFLFTLCFFFLGEGSDRSTSLLVSSGATTMGN